MGDSATFHKLEKLSQKKIIDLIFQRRGQSILKNPILFIYLPVQLATPFPAQVMFSVSKRKFKRAVDRNKVKRLLREAYRTQKHRIYAGIGESKQYALSILYLEDKIPPFQVIEKQLNLAIDEFIERIA